MVACKITAAEDDNGKLGEVTFGNGGRELPLLRWPWELLQRFAWLIGGCFGHRISECMGLKWGDVDWLGSLLEVQRGIVRNRVADCKTVGLKRPCTLIPACSKN